MRRLPLPAFLVLALALASAQSSTTTLRVKVLTAQSRPIHLHAQVDLLNGAGLFLRQAFTDDTGNAEFGDLAPGTYRLRVTDPLVEENMSDVFAVARGQLMEMQLITVRLKAQAEAELKRQEERAAERQATVSALELNVPGNAKKEFQKGVEALGRKDLGESEKRFRRAIELHPQYAMAWNHLGVVYMQQGHPAEGADAFEKAVGLNDHYASALINIGKARMEQKQPAVAEQLLERAVAADPRDPEALTVLASVQYTRKEYAAAAATATRVHPLGDERFAVAHWIAGRSYEEQQKDAEAIAEYTIFLKEAPTGALADKARAALKKLRAANYPSENR